MLGIPNVIFEVITRKFLQKKENGVGRKGKKRELETENETDVAVV